ncbi:MAG: O-antigen ligase family protein [Candidatus Omnitrophica bacterium]|nr:O-antigen ligase family protein [Candidatus Omnitrophota bacterium]MDD5518653.1 O-antigen ligase family protein [Candidatus Omnitrophota bacterium]
MKQKIIVFCNTVIYWSIIAVPFVISFSSAAVEIFIGFMVFTFVLKKIISRDFTLVKTPISLPFALIIGISLLSFINSVDIRASLQGIIKLLKYGFLIVIIAGEVKDRQHLTRIIWAIFAGLLLASLDGIYQFIFGVDFFRHRPYDSIIGLIRLKAAFPHTNIFAGYLALALPLSIPLLLYYLKGKKRIVLLIIAILGFFCLIFTFCRSAIFGVWLVILLMGIIKKDKVVIFLTVLTLLSAPLLAPGAIKDWAKTTHSWGEFLLNKERPVLYETSFNMIKHHPLIGVGVNTYVLNYQKYKLHDTSLDTANTRWYAHNSFLQMACEIGITGVAIFIWLLFLLFSRWRNFYRNTKDNFLALCGLGIVMGLAAFLVHGLTETNLYYPKIAVLFWFQSGLLMGILCRRLSQ